MFWGLIFSIGGLIFSIRGLIFSNGGLIFSIRGLIFSIGALIFLVGRGLIFFKFMHKNALWYMHAYACVYACAWWAKHFKCHHVIEMAVRKGLAEYSETAQIIPLGQKKKRKPSE